MIAQIIIEFTNPSKLRAILLKPGRKACVFRCRGLKNYCDFWCRGLRIASGQHSVFNRIAILGHDATMRPTTSCVEFTCVCMANRAHEWHTGEKPRRPTTSYDLLQRKALRYKHMYVNSAKTS